MLDCEIDGEHLAVERANLRSAVFSFFEKNATGRQEPFTICSNLPPIANPDTSVVTLVSAEGDGC